MLAGRPCACAMLGAAIGPSRHAHPTLTGISDCQSAIRLNCGPPAVLLASGTRLLLANTMQGALCLGRTM